MTIKVDLSQKELHPEAVIDLIEQQIQKRKSKNILFKVSKRTYGLFLKKKHNAISVSAEEADEINKFSGQSSKPEEYGLDQLFHCKECSRELNFFDVFKTAKKHHGDEYIHRLLSGKDFYIQVLKKSHQLETECSNCGTVNMLGPCVSYKTSQY